ncbi:membrane bound O-acyl transferase family-domain-containing protein [Crassisporium funariophilum]|nr:membrane bound O-acyl transferase family-domain-containing protein [Crassisporium funariophilum]
MNCFRTSAKPIPSMRISKIRVAGVAEDHSKHKIHVQHPPPLLPYPPRSSHWTSQSMAIDGRPNYGITLMVLNYSLLVTSYTLKPSPLRTFLFLPILCTSLYITFRTSTGDVMGNHGTGDSGLITLFTARDFILGTEIQRELRQIRWKKGPVYELSLKERARWALNLFFSPRGIGWTHGPLQKRAPSTAKLPESRWRFVAKQLVRMCRNILILDLALLGMTLAVSARTRSLVAQGWLDMAVRRLLNFSFGLWIYANTNAGHCFLTAIAVALGFWDPEDCLNLYGRWSEVYTVRRFWGRGWHQMMRRALTAHHDNLARNVLHLRPKSELNTFVRMYGAFILSGIIHYGGDYSALHHYGGGAFFFFSMQSVAVTLEHLATKAGASLGLKPSRFWRIVGYIWVVIWFSLVLPRMVEPLLDRDRMGESVWDSTIILRHIMSRDAIAM